MIKLYNKEVYLVIYDGAVFFSAIGVNGSVRFSSNNKCIVTSNNGCIVIVVVFRD